MIFVMTLSRISCYLLPMGCFEYEYDLMDNVTQRQNHISGLSEGFTYDALDRLTQVCMQYQDKELKFCQQ
jgi:DNA-binding PadR family transcriptional regulator